MHATFLVVDVARIRAQMKHSNHNIHCQKIGNVLKIMFGGGSTLLAVDVAFWRWICRLFGGGFPCLAVDPPFWRWIPEIHCHPVAVDALWERREMR